LPDQTPVYESVGRMFLLSSKSDIKTQLDGKQETCKDKIKTLEGNKNYLEKNIKESENSLRELILSKKGSS
jgi:prefoldin subunit 1